MQANQAPGKEDLLRLGKRIGAAFVLIALVWIASSLYADFRGAVKSAQTTPSASTAATATAEPTSTSDPGGEESATPASTNPTVLVLAEGLNLREQPRTNANSIKKLKKGTSLELLEEASGWYRVRDAAGDEGWIAAGGNYSKIVK